MRILSWNCNMAFRKKSAILEDFKPDIAILQECESKEVLEEKRANIPYTQYIWFGDNKNKGLGIMTFNGFEVEVLNYNKDFKYVVPLRIYDDKNEVYLLAIWTQLVKKDIYHSYVVQAARSFKYYKDLLDKECIIIGDFNSNAIWDNGDRKEYNHSQMVSILKELRYVSIYHEKKVEGQGKESSPTFYFYRNKEKPFHIDYCFLKDSALNKVESFTIGEHDRYIRDSDHMPLFLTLKDSSLISATNQ
jgi:exonuclease III